MVASDNPASQKLSEVEAAVRVTSENVRAAIQERRIRRWNVRACGICHVPIGYLFGANEIVFDSNCGCTRYWTPPQPRTLDDLVRFFSDQAPDVRNSLWTDFLTKSECLSAEANP